MSFLDPAGHISAALMLRRIEAELGSCRAILAKVETAVETMLQSGEVAVDDLLHIVEMQNIDLLDQTIADLVICLQDVASSPAIGTAQPLRVAHITRRLRLADLQDRLAGRTTPAERGDAVELF
ncbi:MAG: hypothetical protein ABI832_13915 [bacterium]